MGIALIFDILVVIIVLVSAGVSFFRGIIKEVLTIFGFAGGIICAFLGGGLFAPMVQNAFGVSGTDGQEVGKLLGIIPYDMVATIATYGGIFLIIFLGLQFISHHISKGAKAIGLGPVDRTLGVFFGLARAILLLGVLYLPFHLILPDENKEQWFGTSKTFVFVEGATNFLSGFLPASATDENAEKNTREILQGIDVLKDPNKKEIKDEKPIEMPQPSDRESYSDDARSELNKTIENTTPPHDNQ